MPPPPVPSRTHTRSATGTRKGKGKAMEVVDDLIEIIDSDDDLSDEEKAPRKKRNSSCMLPGRQLLTASSRVRY